MAYKSTNPYLEARCTFVLAKLALIGAPDEEDTTYEAMIEAQCLGHRDAEVSADTGETIDCSLFFADVPELQREWMFGWNQYFEMREMEECGSCNSGNPCPIHG
ncbi:hypothetical protein [Cupriavidus malaysiensis]|uniref:Uncharacterized protein n=1 Tax=Cupriavidus malaysiensis TaxID=367825 RepID=A0ABN4TFE8_9BURK|nr:hypothetical protein [Cupriavidus malaysiensis]AOZ05878.1 hypothetical protein BKK80_08640 [Cupriavidus malaysiensis]